MKVLPGPRLPGAQRCAPETRNEFSVLYALYACGCVCRIRFPQTGPELCPRHCVSKEGYTRHAPTDRERPF